jgi:hypothetical protein
MLAKLAMMAPTEALRVQVLNKALYWIFTIPRGAYWMASGFAAIATQLPDDLVERAIKHIMSAAEHEAVHAVSRTISGDKHDDITLGANVIRTLAPFMREDPLDEAENAARRVADDGWRMAGLVFLAPHFPEPRRTSVLREAVEMQRTLNLTTDDPAESYWQPLVALADCLQGGDRSACADGGPCGRSLMARQCGPPGGQAARAGGALGDPARSGARRTTFHAYEISGELPRGEAREILAAAILSDVRHFEWSRGENARALVAFASREDQLALWTQVHAIAAELSLSIWSAACPESRRCFIHSAAPAWRHEQSSRLCQCASRYAVSERFRRRDSDGHRLEVSPRRTGCP